MYANKISVTSRQTVVDHDGRVLGTSTNEAFMRRDVKSRYLGICMSLTRKERSAILNREFTIKPNFSCA